MFDKLLIPYPKRKVITDDEPGGKEEKPDQKVKFIVIYLMSHNYVHFFTYIFYSAEIKSI